MTHTAKNGNRSADDIVTRIISIETYIRLPISVRLNFRRVIMKNTYTNKLTVAVLLASFAFQSLPASARDDDIPSRMQQQVFKLQQQIKEQQIKAAEASKQQADTIQAAECKKLEVQGKKC